ncbi:MAG: hypothetical protein J1F66_03710 [Clostridiales bacterium]|nr:hypothetical protein [Clostridiales bacterium]
MINKKYIQKDLNFIREEFNRKFFFDGKYTAHVDQSKDVKMSLGGRNSLYGLFPPHKHVQILLDSENLGKIVCEEKNIDFKYYFDTDGKVILIERFDPTSQFDNKLVSTVFVEYEKREINTLFCKGKSGNISTVAQCKLDLYGRLIRYMECTCGVNGYPYVYSVMRLKHVAGTIKIKHSVYSIWQEGDETLVCERKYVFKHGKLREMTAK